MNTTLRSLTIATLLTAALSASALGQDAMATDAMAGDAMATDAMSGEMMADDMMADDMMAMSDDELALCLEQAAAITFPVVAEAAAAACHGVHDGMDVMGAIEKFSMEAMSGDAMAPAQ